MQVRAADKKKATHLTYKPELYLRIISHVWFPSWKQLLIDEAARVSVTTVASVWQRATDKWLCLCLLKIWNPLLHFLFHQFLGLGIWAHPFDWSKWPPLWELWRYVCVDAEIRVNTDVDWSVGLKVLLVEQGAVWTVWNSIYFNCLIQSMSKVFKIQPAFAFSELCKPAF